MRTQFFFISFFIFTLYSCGGGGKGGKDKLSSDTLALCRDSLKICRSQLPKTSEKAAQINGSCGLTSIEVGAQVINMDTALKYIFQYNRDFANSAWYYGAGADFDLRTKSEGLDLLNLSPTYFADYCGTELYIIQDLKQYRLAMRWTTLLNGRADPFPIKNENEYVSSNRHFRIREDVSTIAKLEAHLLKVPTYNHSEDFIRKYTAEEVNRLGGYYLYKINFENGDYNYCMPDPIGFFYNQHVDDLFKDNELLGFRIYFGFDPSSPIHKIRLIMFGFKADRKIKTDLILQRSWPPYQQ